MVKAGKDETETVAPRRSARNLEKRKISEETPVPEQAKPKQAKKAPAKKKPSKIEDAPAEAVETEKDAEEEAKPKQAKKEPAKKKQAKIEKAPAAAENEEEPATKETKKKQAKKAPPKKNEAKGPKRKKDAEEETNGLPVPDLGPATQEKPGSDDESATEKVESTGMFKIATWNVAGLYACIKKGFVETAKTLDCDVMCLQETKLSLKKGPPPEIRSELKDWKYQNYANSEGKAGYSGTAIFSKTKPLSVQRGIGKSKHDDFGRSCTAEFEKFYLVTSYVPNSGRGLVNLDYRTKEWESDLRNYLTKLNKTKPVIYCGDLNVAHTAIDLTNDKSNYNKTAGYTQAEIDELEKLLGLGYVDAYRKLYPKEEDCYTFWSYMGGARAKNVGWRLDYFLMKDCEEWVEDVVIHSKVQGSDHCPVEIKLNLP